MSDVETFRDPSKVGKALKNKIMFNGIPYETTVFLTPLVDGTPEYGAVVNKISSRKQFDKTTGKLVTCLGTSMGVVKHQLNTVNTSAYVFVNEPRRTTTDQASGSLQVYNWSADASLPSQSWICDLCRHAPDPSKKSAYSPVKPIMHLFEQLTYYLFGKNEIYLMVEKIKENDLKPLYEKYGFAVDTGFIMRDDDGEYIVMKKTIFVDPIYASFPFLQKRNTRVSKTSKRRRRTSKTSSLSSSSSV